jgi:hypothetical protein
VFEEAWSHEHTVNVSREDWERLKRLEVAQKPTDDELRREAEAAQNAAWSEIHGQDARRKYSVGEVKQIVYRFDNLLSSLLHRPASPSGDECEALARAQWDDPVNVITWDELTAKAERDEGDYREVREYALEAAGRGIAAGFRRPASPSSDEREALINYCPEHGDLLTLRSDGSEPQRSLRCTERHSVGEILVAYRRPVSPEPSGIVAEVRRFAIKERDDIRAALRDAAETTNETGRAEPKHDESCAERCAHCEVCDDSVLYGSRCPDHYLTTDRENGSTER